MGTIQARTCRCSNHRRGDRLLRPRSVLLHVAYDGETKCGKHELLRGSVQRRDDVQSLVLACLWPETLHRSGYGAPELVAMN